MTEPAPGQDSVLVDVDGLPLTELLASDETPLAHSLARIAKELDQPDPVSAGFQSSIM